MSRGTGSAEVDVLSSQLLDPAQIVDEQALATLEAVDGRPPEYTARCGLCIKYLKREHSYGV